MGTFLRYPWMANNDKFIAALDERTKLVKDMQAKESAAQDQKTERLRALRLAKEAQSNK